MNIRGPRWAKRSWVDDDDEVSFVQAFKPPRIEESSVKPQNGSYTIAWICALPIEMAAANAMLDGVHPSLPSNEKDSNSYILGNVGRHNIVVACLPADHYGTNSAAIVANNLIRTFPSIRTGLMVGIGGGVPGSVDVRLGDVVVGYNVVQHDLGKIIQGSRVYRTGTPKSPPSSLLAAVSKLRAIHESRPSRVPSFLQEMIIKHPKMTRYTYPWSSQDWLFRATYSHSLALATCDSCDTSMLVYRPLRMDNHPVIHYDNVASGNQVMKDAISRDEIARELNIICFEMEAAGLSDALPCLVIRGICDYSDSHKNKQWQEYAAAAAAAYAKELLIEAIPVAVMGPTPKSYDSYSAEPEAAVAPWSATGSQWTIPQLQRSRSFLFRQQLCQQLPLSPVLVIDSRGCYLPFHLETIDSKELFVEILKHRFKDLGTNKIERSEWILEHQQNGQRLDLSKDWQSIIKPNQILNMRMIFRRQNHSSTRCPSCGFMNPGLQSDQVQWRIEEIQDIRISSDSASALTDRAKTSPARFPKPRPPKPQNPEDDISRYKQVQLVDVDFKIGLSTVDQLAMKAALKLSSGDLSDTEHLAERLALVYGLSEADSLALSQKIDVQHAHIRFLQRQQLDSDTDPNVVSIVGPKSKQTVEVHFGTADMRAHTRTGSPSPSKMAKEIQDVLRAEIQAEVRAGQEAAATKAAAASYSADHGNVNGGANSSDNNRPLELSYEAPSSHKRDYVLPSANVRNEISRKGGWGSQSSPFFGKIRDGPLAGLMNHSRPEPESDTLDIDAIGAPGGFQRDRLRRDITSPSRGHKNGHKGADLTGTDRPPLTSNFVEFLSMYGHFASEDLEEDDEALGPNGHAQSDVTAVPKDIGEEYEQIPGGSNHHSSAREILNPVDASKRPLTPPDVKGTMSMYDTVDNREPDISLDIAVPETSTRSGLEEDSRYFDASRYQEDVSGGAPMPLTAETLRKLHVSKRGELASSRSTRSSKRSSYYTCLTTQSSAAYNDDFTIKVSGQAVVKVPGAQIEYHGGEIIFSSNRGAGAGSGSGMYGASRAGHVPVGSTLSEANNFY